MPPTAPTIKATRAAVGMDRRCLMQRPEHDAAQPHHAFTDKSISPVMITNVIGNAISKIGDVEE